MKKIIGTLIFIFYFFTAMAQDAHLSQFYAAPLYMGPSFAGSTGGGRAVLNFRDQWPSIPGSFITYSLSFDRYLEKYNSGLGIIAFRDEAGGGKLNETLIGGAYSYKIKITNDFILRPGILLNYHQKTNGYDRLTYSDEIIGGISTSLDDIPSETSGHFNYSLSVLSVYKTFWLGLTADHLMKIHGVLQMDNEYKDIKFSAYGGYKYNIPSRTRSRREESITYAFNFRMQSMMTQLDVGLSYTLEPLFFGIWYRGFPILSSRSYALSLLFGFKFESMTFGYSYDFTISNLITSTGGAHELSLLYSFNTQKFQRRRSREAPVPCPIF